MFRQRSTNLTRRHTQKGCYAGPVWAGRLLFLTVMIVAAIVLGYTTFVFLTRSETKLAETQFASIADRALTEAASIVRQRRNAAMAMAALASEMNPNADQWPFVSITGFERIADNLLKSSTGQDMGFVPFVPIDQQAAFEEFAYNYYNNSSASASSYASAISSFGRGIWAVDETNDAPDHRYHDDGSRYYGSANNILAPVFHVSGNWPLLLFNVYSEEIRRNFIDNMIECTRQNVNNTEVDMEVKCGVITPMMNIVKYNFPGAAIFQPIFPAHNRSTITGYIPTVLLFADVLENIFADEVHGIDCVFEAGPETLTYTIVGGVAQLVGKGDFHNDAYGRFRRTMALTDKDDYTDSSPMYKLSLYPNCDLYDVYSTKNPTTAMIGAIFIMIGTSLVFLLYDLCVRREFAARKDLLEAKRQFMKYISHEIRTPLNSVTMGIEVIKAELSANLAPKLNAIPDDSIQDTSKEKHQELTKDWLLLMQEIQTNVQGAVDVLNDLLNYDKIEHGSIRLELTIIPIWSLIQHTFQEFKLPAKNKNLHFELSLLLTENGEEQLLTSNGGNHLMPVNQSIQIDASQLIIIGDAVRITQVFRNLISNALKFTPEGGNVRVCVSYIQEDRSIRRTFETIELKDKTLVKAAKRGRLQVCVEDTGVGMTKNQLTNLFTDGVQFNVNELQAGQGSGLGLYITKGIVEKHGGTLQAMSEGLGLGTTLTMALPLWHVQGLESKMINHDETDRAYGNETLLADDLASLRVLIVDDVAANRKLLHRMLKSGGHLCDEASNGSMAVDMVMTAVNDGVPYDTLLMDYEMPGMNGPEAAKHIRKNGLDVFIVGITGNVLPEDLDHFRSCGANVVLPKPLRLADLREIWIEYGIVGHVYST